MRDLADKDSAARDFIAQRLPSMISCLSTTDFVWMNAVLLGGQFKVTSTIPALKLELSRGLIQGGYDYSGGNYPTTWESVKLQYDLVARAWSDFGDPVVPLVADVLSKGDDSMRKRALSILSKINFPKARPAM